MNKPLQEKARLNKCVYIFSSSHVLWEVFPAVWSIKTKADVARCVFVLLSGEEL